MTGAVEMLSVVIVAVDNKQGTVPQGLGDDISVASKVRADRRKVGSTRPNSQRECLPYPFQRFPAGLIHQLHRSRQRMRRCHRTRTFAQSIYWLLYLLSFPLLHCSATGSRDLLLHLGR